jgi:hypothetical protein
MNNRNLAVQVFYFILYIALQLLVVRNLVLFNVAFCYIYIAFLLLIPFEMNRQLYLLIGFITGVITDVFYDTIGIHAAACVLLAYMRPIVTRFLTPRGGYDAGMQPTLREMGLEWFMLYCSLMIGIHHFALFYLEASGFTNFFFTLGKVIMSTVFSLILMVLIQYLFYNPRRS